MTDAANPSATLPVLINSPAALVPRSCSATWSSRAQGPKTGPASATSLGWGNPVFRSGRLECEAVVAALPLLILWRLALRITVQAPNLFQDARSVPNPSVIRIWDSTCRSVRALFSPAIGEGDL